MKPITLSDIQEEWNRLANSARDYEVAEALRALARRIAARPLMEATKEREGT